MRKLIFALLMICSLFSNAQYLTSRIENNTQSIPNGVVYFLPENVLRIELNIVETRYYIGPYAEFAKSLLGTDDYIKSNKTEFEIHSVDMAIGSKPDHDACFIVSIDDKSKDAQLKISLTDDGVLKSFGYDIPEDLAPQYLRLSETKNENSPDFPDIRFADVIDNKEDDDSVGFNDVMTKEDKARLALDKIEKSRNAYYELASGFQEVAYGNAIVDMAKMLKGVENEYISLFIGKKVSMKYKKVYYITPGKNHENGSIVIAKLSDKDGLLPSNSKNGDVIKLQFETDNCIPDNIRNSEDKTYPNRLISRIPAISNVKVLINNDILSEQSFNISQFGSFAGIQASNNRVIFNPNTGQVISISK